MEDFASHLLTLPPPFNMVVLVILLLVTGGVLQSLIKAVRVYADHRADERFKLELIQNGLSAEEAQRWTRLSVGRKRKWSSLCSREMGSRDTERAEEYDASSVLA